VAGAYQTQYANFLLKTHFSLRKMVDGSVGRSVERAASGVGWGRGSYKEAYNCGIVEALHHSAVRTSGYDGSEQAKLWDGRRVRDAFVALVR
jgi:hypothetical protein